MNNNRFNIKHNGKNTPKMPSKERAVQDKVSSLYDDIRYRKPYSRTYHLWWSKMMLSSVPAEGKWLHIGCGTGWLLIAEKELGGNRKLIGIDLSHEMLVRAQNNGMTVAEADVLNLPFKNNYFDVIHSKGVLHHIDDFESALREIKRVLKPNGTLILADPNSGPLRWMENLIGHRDDHFSETHKSLSADLYNKILSRHFKTTHFSYFGLFAYPFCIPDIIDLGRYFPAPTLLVKTLIGVDRLLTKIPGLRRLSWAFFVIAKKTI